MNVNLPAQAAVGAYHELTEDLTLVATVNWQNWSRFGEPEIGVSDGNTVTVNLNYKDTYHAGLGAYYRVAERWLLAVGFGYDTPPTSSVTERSPVLPLGATFHYAGGVQYDWSKDLSLGVAHTLIDAGTGKVKGTGGPFKGDLKGEYDPNFIHAFNLNFVYRFQEGLRRGRPTSLGGRARLEPSLTSLSCRKPCQPFDHGPDHHNLFHGAAMQRCLIG
jgi:long-chain fatty acid transport protein